MEKLIKEDEYIKLLNYFIENDKCKEYKEGEINEACKKCQFLFACH